MTEVTFQKINLKSFSDKREIKKKKKNYGNFEKLWFPKFTYQTNILDDY